MCKGRASVRKASETGVSISCCLLCTFVDRSFDLFSNIEDIEPLIRASIHSEGVCPLIQEQASIQRTDRQLIQCLSNHPLRWTHLLPRNNALVLANPKRKYRWESPCSGRTRAAIFLGHSLAPRVGSTKCSGGSDLMGFLKQFGLAVPLSCIVGGYEYVGVYGYRCRQRQWCIDVFNAAAVNWQLRSAFASRWSGRRFPRTIIVWTAPLSTRL